VPILSTSDYPAIRAAIDVSLSDLSLPDSVIVLDMYAGAGVRDVLRVDPLAASRTGDALAHANTAAIMFTAARLAGVVPQIVKEAFPDHSYERKAYDPLELAGQLRASAGAELDAYLEPGALEQDRPTMFAVARANRGRW
jgi:hypothetical protein